MLCMKISDCTNILSQMRKYFKFLISLTGTLLLITIIAYQMGGDEDELDDFIDSDMQLMTNKLMEVEDRSNLVMRAIFKSVAKVEAEGIDDYIDQVTGVWIDYMEDYNMLYGVKGHFKNNTEVKLIRLEKNKYLRMTNYDNAKEIFCEQISQKDRRLVVNDTWYQMSGNQNQTDDWVYQIRINEKPIVTSTFYSAPLFNEPVVSISKFDTYEQEDLLEMMSLKISLLPLTRYMYSSGDADNLYILSDGQQHVVLTDSADDREVTSYFEVSKKEVNKFLDKTARKQYYPNEFITYREGGIHYRGQWQAVKFGNKDYKLGVIAKLKPKNGQQIAYFAVLGNELMVLMVLMFLHQKMKASSVYEEAADVCTCSNVDDEQVNEDIQRIREDVDNYLANDKKYLKVDCNLGSISDELGIERELISRVVRQSHQKSMKELINDYRIQAAIDFLESEGNVKTYSMDYMAQQFGFNSRTTFYREFKKRTNYTPVEFQAIKSS